MIFKSIRFWSKNNWKNSNIKTDSIKIETKNYIIDIIDDSEVKKVMISSKIRKDKKGRPQTSFISFID